MRGSIARRSSTRSYLGRIRVAVARGKRSSVLFGRNVRRLRLARDMTLEELGAQCGYHRSRIHEIEHGRSMPNPRRLPTMARSLHCTIDDLFRGMP